MKVIKGILYSVGALILLAVITVSAWFYFMGSHTKYCPLSHRASDLSVCFVRDKLEGNILIQHGDLDTNWYYLEIRDGNNSEKYNFPEFIYQVGKND